MYVVIATIPSLERDHMYLDKPLQTYLDELASSQPTPGGGSAAALSGAMGAGLASMVARLTLGKDAYASVQQEIEGISQHTERLRARFQQLMQEDIEAYGRLSATFKLPRTTPEEKAARTDAIQKQLANAALVPLEIAECSAELAQYCLRIAEIGNANVLSDIATATALVSSAGTGASWMVRTNLRAMKDLEQVNTLSNRLGVALDTIAAYSQQVVNKVGERA
jgi:methenyltetrahydrofolate cyclohydrolase